jgi:hypothetical protein
MRFLSHIKNINVDMVINNTLKLAVYSGAFTGTIGGIHAAYIFSPDRSRSIPHNSTNLMIEVTKDTYLYGVMGVINGIIWPISIPCWIINTIKCVKG